MRFSVPGDILNGYVIELIYEKNVECGYNCLFSAKSCDFFLRHWGKCYLASYNKTDTEIVFDKSTEVSSSSSSFQNLGKYTI